MALFKKKDVALPAGKAAVKSGALRAAKKVKTSSIAKFILFVGDEGAVLVHSKNNVVKSRQFVSDASKTNLDTLKSYMASDTKSPLLMVTDNIDQSYIQQTLPPVSSLSVQKLIKRRLDRDFGANDIKGAIPLGREASGRKDWNFMMVALEKTPQISAWLDFVLELPNPFDGICLAAVEVENIVRNLDFALEEIHGESGSEWKFFVSHNKVGGFRQVILRKGRIIFTRMAQPMGESTPEVIAGNIEQEMTSTIEYMRRLSFDAQSGLDIYIIASAAIKAALDKSKFNSRNIYIMTPFEAAHHLNIEGATQPTDQFGDVVLATSIGSMKKHVLTLMTSDATQLNKMSRGILYERVLAVAITIGGILYAGSVGYDIYEGYSAGGELAQQKAEQEKHLAELREKIASSGMDIEKTSDMIDMYKKLTQQMLSPASVIPGLQSALKPPIVVKSFEWSLEGSNPSEVTTSSPPAQKMVFTFTLQFPGVTNAEGFKAVSKKLRDDLQQALNVKAEDIAFGKVPPAFTESDKLDVTIGGNEPAAPANPSLELELVVKKIIELPSDKSK